MREHRTPARMLDALDALCGALIVTDRGIATEECAWRLRGQGYRDLVVGRKRARHFDAEHAVRIRTAANRGVHLHKVVSDDGRAVRPYCFFEERAAKERASVERFGKRIEQVRERIGRPGARSRGGARHYDIALETDPSEQHAIAVRFSRRPASGSMVTHSDDWDEATLWRTHMTLTGIGAVLRSSNSNPTRLRSLTTSPSGPRAIRLSPSSPTNPCK